MEQMYVDKYASIEEKIEYKKNRKNNLSLWSVMLKEVVQIVVMNLRILHTNAVV
jgi:hypothetical protein